MAFDEDTNTPLTGQGHPPLDMQLCRRAVEYAGVLRSPSSLMSSLKRLRGNFKKAQKGQLGDQARKRWLLTPEQLQQELSMVADTRSSSANNEEALTNTHPDYVEDSLTEQAARPHVTTVAVDAATPNHQDDHDGFGDWQTDFADDGNFAVSQSAVLDEVLAQTSLQVGTMSTISRVTLDQSVGPVDSVDHDRVAMLPAVLENTVDETERFVDTTLLVGDASQPSVDDRDHSSPAVDADDERSSLLTPTKAIASSVNNAENPVTSPEACEDDSSDGVVSATDDEVLDEAHAFTTTLSSITDSRLEAPSNMTASHSQASSQVSDINSSLMKDVARPTLLSQHQINHSPFKIVAGGPPGSQQYLQHLLY